MKWLSCNVDVGGGRVDEGALREMILGFVVEHLIFGTQNIYIYKRKSPKCPRILGGLKHQLPSSLTSLTDVFPTQQGKAYNFRFGVRQQKIDGENPLYFALSWDAEKKIPCGALSTLPTFSFYGGAALIFLRLHLFLPLLVLSLST